ncbi:YtxH domain-containing protein [Pontibacter akesuensis]|uniref:YtxH-like protein n=1 Tax=Pontibacter akesuensis TaxID=388950 RepID=A0A1I7K143_9BACT|nr:YtxH domain-containing protein [Pontibacter akesuensis]GHA75907.1 hypothetical protein GCM10007389_32290 [Pontibacter akesuensis]SFU91147.1 YtxH-like protein [Pontibacter akesuensis]
MKDNSGKVLLAMLAGASAGVIAGLLMAPDTGEVTRGGIKKWAGKMSKDLEKNLQDGLEEIKRMSAEKLGKSGEGSSSGSATSGSTTSGASTGSTAGASSTGGSTGSTGSTGSSTSGSTGTSSTSGSTGAGSTGSGSTGRNA